ncbi:hypothetical protein CC85DRAFT_310362 [Cutaneotrichosporon oleaginosum]|uniref:HECT domain-containing protein n=1 Tax=Cutaneotrichosporon oleaginosum TaxID=879819 RepID=A0A0J1BDA7_9TREE|nr:uncharacterized protein CC85DRAFT_310362 [Cutaneotrichosporon oleaginosum]KLT46039.1 hypothetical protein CC85DRAFT_310362 [Cutaneotrichosporon oleaginosum]TXT06733.1 hypothetical protein COLE_06064 [Cutaneotrichosporon oleaginosum]
MARDPPNSLCCAVFGRCVIVNVGSRAVAAIEIKAIGSRGGQRSRHTPTFPISHLLYCYLTIYLSISLDHHRRRRRRRRLCLRRRRRRRSTQRPPIFDHHIISRSSHLTPSHPSHHTPTSSPAPFPAMAELTMERPATALSNFSCYSDSATRSHSDHLHNALQLDEVDALGALPPPPAPFPMEQLALLLAASNGRQALEDDRVSDVLSDAGTDASDVTVSVEYDYDDMTELNLVGIQRHCADCIEILVRPHTSGSGSSAGSADKELAAKLGDLLEATYELETFHPSSACCSPATPAEEDGDQSPFLALVHALLGAQAVVAQRQPRPAPQNLSSETSEHPVEVVREELAWARVETLARDIVDMVRARDDEDAPRFSSEEDDDVKSILSLPPKYRRSERDSAGSGSSRVSGPPAYKDYRDDRVLGETASAVSGKDRKSGELSSPRSMHSALSSIAPILNDLDTVTHAIERLHTMAPQLDDQRIALRTSAQRRTKPAPAPLSLKKPSEARLRELDDLWDKIERAHAPTKEAAVALDDRRLSRKSYMFRELPPTPASAPASRNVSRTRSRREDVERTTFLEELMENSASTRMRDQDVPLRPRAALPKPSGYLEEAIDRSPARLGTQDFPIPLETFLANKRKQTAAARSANPTIHNSDKAPSISAYSTKSSKSSTLKARRKFKEKDLFAIVADAGSRLPNQDAPPPTPKRKAFLSLTGNAPPRAPLSSTGWLPRVGSRELLTPRTPVTPSSPWGRTPSIGPRTPTSPAFPPSLYDEPTRTSEPRSIRKLMGQLVRRGSTTSLKDSGSANTTPKCRPVPLPPPPPPAIDPDAVGYLCETQENLRVVQVMLYGGDTALATDLELEVTTPGGAVVTSRSDPNVRINIALPSAVPLGQRVPFVLADGHMEAKLAALPMSAASLNAHITHALSAPSLRQLAPRSLCCTQCDREIAEFPSGVAFKDLPSEHWAEMLEVWMCHADPAFTAHIAKQTKDGFWPTNNTVLVGGSYLLVSGNDVCKTKLVEQESSEPDEWRRVSCPCGEVLGKVRQSGYIGAGTVRFNKWAISLMRGRGIGEIEHVRFPVSCFVVSDMLELSQAHAAYRFLIADEATGAPRLALWLFNPSMHVAYRRPAKATFSLTSAPPAPSRPSSERPGRLGMRASGDRARGRNASSTRAGEPARSMRAAKIMFKLLDGADRGTAGLPGFGGAVETMRYPRDVCDSLIAALRASTTVYPASRRALGAFSAGFLERV